MTRISFGDRLAIEQTGVEPHPRGRSIRGRSQALYVHGFEHPMQFRLDVAAVNLLQDRFVTSARYFDEVFELTINITRKCCTADEPIVRVKMGCHKRDLI